MLRLGTKPQGIWCVKLSRTNKDLALWANTIFRRWQIRLEKQISAHNADLVHQIARNWVIESLWVRQQADQPCLQPLLHKNAKTKLTKNCENQLNRKIQCSTWMSEVDVWLDIGTGRLYSNRREGYRTQIYNVCDIVWFVAFISSHHISLREQGTRIVSLQNNSTWESMDQASCWQLGFSTKPQYHSCYQMSFTAQ